MRVGVDLEFVKFECSVVGRGGSRTALTVSM